MEDSYAISATLKGDIDSFEILVNRYYRGLFNHLYVMVRDESLADDLAQESFIQAFKALRRYNPEYRFSTWLYRIGTNLALKSLRKQRSIRLDDIPELPDGHDPGKATIVEQTEAQVRAAIALLPLKYQTVISLFYWHDQSYDEIATTLSVPVGTIKTWLHRAKQALKHSLEESLWID